MMADADAPLCQASRFLDDHGACPDVVTHLFWIPRDGSAASATLTCGCGGRIVIPMPAEIARVLVWGFASRGCLVTMPAMPAAGAWVH